MSVTERSKVRRRRSIRLSRQSSTQLVPLVSDQELSDCPCEDGIDSATVTCPSSSVYNTGNDLDVNCGSFWEEVDEYKPRRKNKSRRPNIGFHVARSDNEADVRVVDDDPPCVTHGGSSLTIHTSASLHETEANPEQHGLDPAEPAAETPEIEIPRRPCPDASPYIQTPMAYLTGTSNLDLSQSKTPGVISDKSLPSIQTPSSVGVNIGLGSVKEFDDAFMLGMDTPTSSQDALVGCPPSCEDDSEDSLLICTPDLSKFKKNIRFRCSLDFSELDQTPSKGDNAADKSQDSIHESPIVGYMYDKLNASDVIRKRRSISRQSGNVSSMQLPASQTLGVPKRLLPTDNKPETRDVEEPEAKPTFHTKEVSVQSVSSSQSSSTSGSYTSCVEEQDILSAVDAQPSSLPSPVLTTLPAAPQPEPSASDLRPVPASDVQHTSQPVSVSADAVQTDQCVNESEVNSLGVEDHDDTLHFEKTEASVEFEDIPKQFENDMSVPHDVTLEKESTEDQMSESKSKERNIASDVCEMFRSLARKFSGSKKKKRRSGSLKTQRQPRLLENEKESLPGENVAGSDGIFSFRKEPKLSRQLSGETVKSAGDSTPKVELSKSLDFSPFLPPAENDCNVTNVDATPVSPVWKLQSDQPDSVQVDADDKTGEQLVVSSDGDTPLIMETVLQAKSTNVECEESEEKLAPMKKGRPKRRSIETSVLRQECKEFQATEPIPVEEEEENSSLRRSRRTRRSSLEMFRHHSQTAEGFGGSSESVDSTDSENESKPKKNRSRKKVVPSVLEENLEELYRNKNYTLPTERMWETLFESPEKSKQPNVLQSRRKYRRTITFDTIPPAKMRKRLQRAMSQGWDVTGKKRRSIPLDEVKNKIAILASEIE